MKNFSPIVGYRVGPFFKQWCVRAEYENGAVETCNVALTKEGAKADLARRAARKGFTVSEDGERAERPA